jgi:hypothetical protein
MSLPLLSLKPGVGKITVTKQSFPLVRIINSVAVSQSASAIAKTLNVTATSLELTIKKSVQSVALKEPGESLDTLRLFTNRFGSKDLTSRAVTTILWDGQTRYRKVYITSRSNPGGSNSGPRYACQQLKLVSSSGRHDSRHFSAGAASLV